MRVRSLFAALFLMLSIAVNAANTKTTVSQVTSAVSLTEDVDYIISGSTPFTSSGSVDIQNTEHAALIIQAYKPSVVISKWLQYVKINGEAAVDGTNCQVKMYNKGTIILPYGAGFSPLTCYTEPNFSGESCNSYIEGNSGGFMITLTDAKLNNQIRSFKLKRGYMVTFALGVSGWGYSRCFVADEEDIEMSSMPTNMDARISSYRIFKWNYFSKIGIASTTDANVCNALNAEACYTWSAGTSLLPDAECIPNHIYENWPSPSSLGSVNFSCHMKTNNEPYNKSDDHPQTVSDILANWEQLMRTGMRLCTPSSWDGTDYWNGTGTCIAPFLDSIDARGWRCDIVDAHCYWAGNFDALEKYWWPNYNRPIWISEWIWGASWNSNGCWGSGVTDTDIYNNTKSILSTIINSAHIERYFYWNSESKGHIYENGALTNLGKYYASVETGLGFNNDYQYIPTVVNFNPSDLTGTYSKSKGTYTLNWNDNNGDMLDSVTVECKLPNATKYAQIAKMDLQDKSSSAGATYSYVYSTEESGAYYFRVCSYPMGKKTPLYSDEISVTVSASFGDDRFQYGKLPVTDLNAVSTSFSESLSETPAIFMGLCSNNNGSLFPGNLVTNTGSSKFDYQILPWDNSTLKTLNKMEEIPFLAMQPGNYTFDDLDCEIGVARIQDTVQVEFTKAFPDEVTPIVLVELRNPIYKVYPISLNVFDVTNTGFTAVCQYETSVAESASIRTKLYMSYMAITPGLGNMITEYSSSEVLSADTVSMEIFPISEEIDSVQFVIDQNVRRTYSNISILAGTAENKMYGTAARQCTFVADGDTLYFKNPKIFGRCQTSNYPGATILRLYKQIKDTDTSSDNYGKVYAVTVRRQHDSSNPAPTTSSSADDLGYVVVDQGADTYDEITQRITTYKLVKSGTYTGITQAPKTQSTQIVAIYSLSGARLTTLQKGLNIIRYSDGRTEKKFIR